MEIYISWWIGWLTRTNGYIDNYHIDVGCRSERTNAAEALPVYAGFDWYVGIQSATD